MLRILPALLTPTTLVSVRPPPPLPKGSSRHSVAAQELVET